jgi:hydrogenase maturation protease
VINKKTLIVGLGNDILTDDGIGPKLVLDLALIIHDPNIRFDTAACGGLEIIERISGYKKVIFIDAFHSHDGKPGKVYYFVPSNFEETMNLSNLHDINFLTALKLGNSLNMDLPGDIHIIAVEIIEDMEFSTEFTPLIKEKYPIIFEEVLAIVMTVLGKG